MRNKGIEKPKASTAIFKEWSNEFGDVSIGLLAVSQTERKFA